MATFERTLVVEAPQLWLFDVMQRYDRRLEWDPFLSEARLLGDATESALGVRAWCVDHAGRGMETEYVSFRRPRRVAVRMTKGPFIFAAFAGSWIYRELAPRRTEVTFKYHVEARLFGRTGDRLLARFFAHRMTERLALSKSRLEALFRADQAARLP